VTPAISQHHSLRRSITITGIGTGTGTGTGTVNPNDASQRVYLQRPVSGVWKTAATAILSSPSGYTLYAKPPTKKLTDRVYKSTDRDHVVAAGAKPDRHRQLIIVRWPFAVLVPSNLPDA
jgi:hypothetical protein